MQTSSFSLFKASPGAIRIARGAPRWLRGGRAMPYVEELSPEWPWMKMPKADYDRLFHARLDGLDPQEIWDRCHSLVHPYEPVLLCYEKAPLHENNWCHRRMVAEWIETHLEVVVPEFGVPLDLFSKEANA